MKTTLLTQPFDADNSIAQLGYVLSNLLDSTNPLFNQIWIVSAFANQHAVDYLAPHLQTAISNGAKVRVIVGIDHKSTSIEALQSLLALDIETRVAHNNQPGHTFHPKIYLFEAEGNRAELFIGSNNLTLGGLFTNYEASTQITFDFPADEGDYAEFKHSLKRLLDPPEVIVEPLTEGLIANLIARGEIVPEKQMRATAERRSSPKKETSDLVIPASLFGNEPIQGLPSRATRASSPATPIIPSGIRGTLVWEKKDLPASDVQRQPGHPTGGIRLTQAGWTVNGELIDQTSYFRFDIFNELYWESGNLTYEDQESAQADFAVEILGVNYGVRTLKISHKPSGEAGQRNYTTILHWGSELAETIRDLNLVDRTFRLYAPTEGSDIFAIEIT